MLVVLDKLLVGGSVFLCYLWLCMVWVCICVGCMLFVNGYVYLVSVGLV